MIPGNLLMDWITIIRMGTLETLKKKIDWIAPVSNEQESRRRFNTWCNVMESLGNIQIDWQKGVWRVSGLTFVALPYAAGVAVCAGERSSDLHDIINNLDSNEIFADRIDSALLESNSLYPSPLWVNFEKVQTIREVAEVLGATYVGPISLTLSKKFFDPIKTKICEPPSYDSAVRQWSSETLSFSIESDARKTHWRDGFYKISSFGGSRYQVRHIDKWILMSRDEGTMFQLSCDRKNPFQWEPEYPGSDFGCVSVSRFLALPGIIRTALILSSGLEPVLSSDRKTVSYTGVHESIYAQLAECFAKKWPLYY